MAHHTAKDGYRRFAERLNQFPQGAPPTELLFQTLRVLVTEQEAAWLSQVPIRPFAAKRAAAAWKIALPEARKRLEHLADKCLLLDVVKDDDLVYMLPPPMAGFFEFSLARVDGIDVCKIFYNVL